jgi:hypothetical protein
MSRKNRAGVAGTVPVGASVAPTLEAKYPREKQALTAMLEGYARMQELGWRSPHNSAPPRGEIVRVVAHGRPQPVLATRDGDIMNVGLTQQEVIITILLWKPL